MNRAQRRRIESEERRRERQQHNWRKDIARFTGAAQGALENYIIHTDDYPELLLTAASGDSTAMALASSLAMWREKSAKVEAVPGSVFLCLDCDQPFGPNTATPAAFTITVPFANRDCAIVTGICETCAGRGEDLQAMALRHLKKLWPGAYLATGGRA